MTQEARALLEAFEHLAVEERRAVAAEILRRSLPFESGPISDDDIHNASAALFRSLNEEDANTPPR